MSYTFEFKELTEPKAKFERKHMSLGLTLSMHVLISNRFPANVMKVADSFFGQNGLSDKQRSQRLYPPCYLNRYIVVQRLCKYFSLVMKTSYINYILKKLN